jgi:hypothetical protein
MVSGVQQNTVGKMNTFYLLNLRECENKIVEYFIGKLQIINIDLIK